MPRVLTVARARVHPGDEAAYLAAAAEVAAHARRAGRHFWLFRRPGGLFLEFSESPAPDAHPVQGGAGEGERAATARLRALATYEPGADELWDEVPLARESTG